MESKIIYDSSIDQGLIKSMKVAVIGFDHNKYCSNSNRAPGKDEGMKAATEVERHY